MGKQIRLVRIQPPATHKYAVENTVQLFYNLTKKRMIGVRFGVKADYSIFLFFLIYLFKREY